MQKYEDNLAANSSGGLRPLSGASVVVTDRNNGLPASLYSDDGITPLAQPLTTNNDGYFSFYAADGKYVLTFTGPRFATFTREVVLEDPEDNPYATLAQLGAPTGSTLVRHLTAPLSEVLVDLAQAIEDIEAGTSYTLPTATASVLGGIKLGANLTADVNGVVSAGLTNGAIVSSLASAATVARTHVFPDKNGTVAMTSDIPASASAMILLGSATVSTAVANIDFSSLFTSAYDKYIIEVQGILPSTSTTLLMRFAKAGAVDTASVYNSGSSSVSVSVTAMSTAISSSYTIEVRNANDAVRRKGIGVRGLTYSTGNDTVSGEHAYDSANVVTGFRLYANTGNIVAGTVRVYGIKNS